MQNAIITGCNRGIGEGIAATLYSAGYTVTGLNRTLSNDSRINEIQCDVTSYDQVAAAIQQSPKPIDVVVANAAIRRFAEVEHMTMDDWRDSVDTNLNGVFHLAKETIPYLKQSEGSLIVIGSHAEKYPFEQGGAYCATKAALKPFVDCIIEETRYEGVKTTYISIGAVKNRDHGGEESWKLTPQDIGESVLHILSFPENVLPSYIDLRPQKPLREGAKGIDQLQTK